MGYEPSVFIIDFYRRVWAHSDATVETLSLDAAGGVPWWAAEQADVALHQMIVLIIGETYRSGHADRLEQAARKAAEG